MPPTFVVKLAAGGYLDGRNRMTWNLTGAQRFPSRMAALKGIAAAGHQMGSGAAIMSYQDAAAEASAAPGRPQPSPKG